MDYNKVRNQRSKPDREKIFLCIIAVLITAILVQCAALIVHHSAGKNYKAMYDEALKVQLDMQKAINRLESEKSGTSDER